MSLKKQLSTKDIISIFYDIDRELDELGVQRKLSLYCIGGTKLMLQNKKDTSKDIDFIIPHRDYITLGEIIEGIQKQRDVIIDRFQDGQMPGYSIPDYQTKSREANYHFESH